MSSHSDDQWQCVLSYLLCETIVRSLTPLYQVCGSISNLDFKHTRSFSVNRTKDWPKAERTVCFSVCFSTTGRLAWVYAVRKTTDPFTRRTRTGQHRDLGTTPSKGMTPAGTTTSIRMQTRRTSNQKKTSTARRTSP